jgi:DNA-binding protein H-NS
MTKPDISMSLDEMFAARNKFEADRLAMDAAILHKQVEEKEAHVSEVLSLVEKYGLTKDDLFKEVATIATKDKTVGKKSGSTGSVPVKYRDDKGHSWSGRGLTPKWLEAEIEAGKKKEDFLITPPVEKEAPAA